MVKQVIHSIARASYESPKLVILAYFMMFTASIIAMSGLEFDMSNEGTLRADSPVRVNYNQFKDTFGRDDFMMVAAKLDESKSLEDNLASFKALKREIEASSAFIEKIDSFTNIRYTHSIDDTLFINELSEVYESGRWGTPSQFLKFSSNNPLYRNRFISSDEQYLALNIKLKAVYAKGAMNGGEAAGTDSLLTADFDAAPSGDASTELTPVGAGETGEAIDAVLNIIREHPTELYMSGSPYILDALNKLTISDSALTGSLALLFTILFLIYFFRRASAVVFPLSIITLSIVISLGMMAFMGMPYTLYIGAMYPLMIAVGTADSVHIMSRFFPEYEQTNDKKQSILYAIDFSAHAILLTSVTTAVGFLSFVTGDLESISNLGMNMAFAVMMAFVLSITLIPAGISLFNIKQTVNNQTLFEFMERYLTMCARFSIKYAKPIVVLTLIVFSGLLYNTKNLVFSHDSAAILPEHEIAKHDYYHLNKVFKATNPIDVIVDTGKDGGVFDLDVLNALEQVELEFDEKEFGGLHFNQPNSIISIIKEMHSALNNNDAQYYVIPTDIDVIRQEVNLFESSAKDDLFEVVDEGFRRLRVTLMVEDANGVVYQDLLPKIQASFERALPDQNIVITGNTALIAETVPSALTTMYRSYASAFVVITLLIMLLVKSIKLGVISIIPNLLPILLVLNLMIVMSWPLDLTSIMVGSIAIGIVVDDTLHYLHRYTEFKHQGLGINDSIIRTTQTTGKAMLVTSIIYAMATFCNTFSSMSNIIIFGISLSSITILALLADIIIAPALIVTLNKKDT